MQVGPPDQGTKIPHATEQLSQQDATTESNTPEGKISHDTMKILCAATKIWHNQINKYNF